MKKQSNTNRRTFSPGVMGQYEEDCDTDKLKIYRNGRYTSKYPFIIMKVGDVFTYDRKKFPNLAYTAYKYAERIRDRTCKPFGLQLTTVKAGRYSTTTVKRVE